MTNREAIVAIESLKALVEWSEPMEYQVASDMAIEALERQIPKRPHNQWGNNVCPSCRTETRCRQLMFWEHYCPDCGQAIDWSKENDK